MQVLPDPATLDLLELLRLGLHRPDRHGPIRIAGVPAGTGAVELTDAEGVPLARLDRSDPAADAVEITDRAVVRWLGRISPRPFERLYGEPADSLAAEPNATSILVDRTITSADIKRIAGEGPVLLLVPAGPSTVPTARALGTLRSALAVTRDRPGSRVIALPHEGSPAGSDDRLLTDLLAAYAPGPVHRLDPVRADADRPDGTGVVLFFTGLSGSGKSTIARAVRNALLEREGRPVTLLDGDVVRRNLSAGLGFSPHDRDINVRRIGWVAAQIAQHGGLAICSPIAPYDSTRTAVRDLVHDVGGRFVLVHVSTPVQECERRDRKGLYAKARAGQIADFTGVTAPYEAPTGADLVIDTSIVSVAQARDAVLAILAKPSASNHNSTIEETASGA